MPGGSFNWRASSNILPSTFTSPDTAQTGGYYSKQSDGTLPILGVSQEGVYNAPGTDADTGYAAVSGQPIAMYENDNYDEPLVQIGATVSAGQYLVSDSLGRAVPLANQATGAKYFIGGMARQSSATVSSLVRMMVLRQEVYNV